MSKLVIVVLEIWPTGEFESFNALLFFKENLLFIRFEKVARSNTVANIKNYFYNYYKI